MQISTLGYAQIKSKTANPKKASLNSELFKLAGVKQEVAVLKEKNVAKSSSPAAIPEQKTIAKDKVSFVSPASIRPAASEIPVASEEGAGRLTWASAWRQGWEKLLDASQKLAALAKKAQSPGVNEKDLSVINAEFKQTIEDAVQFGQALFDKVKPQLDRSQIVNWQHAFSTSNFGLKNGITITTENADSMAKITEKTASRFEWYNKWMNSYHKQQGWV
jgi:hypothetical protein